jgi:dihydroorotate dehydrogenase (NAD+) catalytic subunit
MAQVIKNGCGGITIKTLFKDPRPGHPNPTMFGTEHYFINAVGLSGAGVKEGIEEMKKFKSLSDAPLIGSISAGTTEEFAEVAELISEAPIDLLEVNVSCPNVGQEFGSPFAYSTEAVEMITKKVKAKTKVPVSIKLAPGVWNIGDIAKAAESAGADAITAGNTIGGMAIDVRAKYPILHNKVGGVSGPALFPVALKFVYDVYKAVKIPIIGTGGITEGVDALAMVMAGATLLGVGSAVYYRGEDVFKKITDEMENIMKEEGIVSLGDIRGVAHR